MLQSRERFEKVIGTSLKKKKATNKQKKKKTQTTENLTKGKDTGKMQLSC